MTHEIIEMTPSAARIKKNHLAGKYPAPLAVLALRLFGYLISKTFWFIRHRGLENIPNASVGGLIIAANHQTYLDPGWICLPIGGHRFRFMAFDVAFGWPLIGPFMKYMGAFPVSVDASGSFAAMSEALQTIREGAKLVVFPEGERERSDGNLLPFKTGAVRIAMETGAPILSVTITGGNRIWPPNQKFPRFFRRVEVIYHPLLYVKPEPGLNAHENIELYTSKLREIIGQSMM